MIELCNCKHLALVNKVGDKTQFTIYMCINLPYSAKDKSRKFWQTNIGGVEKSKFFCKVEIVLRREIGCVFIIQQKFQNFYFFHYTEKFKFSEFLLDDMNATYLSS